jgi:hypothetical protein
MPLLTPARRQHSPAAVASYYSMRRLSPYQGTIQIVEMPSFRAMSADGVSWEMRLEHAGMRPIHALWREGEAYDVEINERTAPLLNALRDRPPLPFKLADTLELWLLDARDALPLALLASTLPHMAPPSTVNTHWRAAFSGDDCFISPSLQAAATRPAQLPFIPHREILNRCVSKAAGARARAQWFRRGPNGAGVGLNGSGIEPALFNREIECSWFPELLLREEWDSDVEAGLVRDYHDWLAPSLLTHSNLPAALRDRLERAACAQAEKLYRTRHVLPEIINNDLVEVALVEAVLRRACNSPVA